VLPLGLSSSNPPLRRPRLGSPTHHSLENYSFSFPTPPLPRRLPPPDFDRDPLSLFLWSRQDVVISILVIERSFFFSCSLLPQRTGHFFQTAKRRGFFSRIFPLSLQAAERNGSFSFPLWLSTALFLFLKFLPFRCEPTFFQAAGRTQKVSCSNFSPGSRPFSFSLPGLPPQFPPPPPRPGHLLRKHFLG